MRHRKIRVSTGTIDRLAVHLSISKQLSTVPVEDEVAKAVIFLASDDSNYITDIELFIYGGIGQI